MKLTVAGSDGKHYTLLILFYAPNVLRLRFDPFSEKPYADGTGSGFSYAIVDDRKVDGQEQCKYAIVKEKPDNLDIKVFHDKLCWPD